jgi:hypothetical protein
MPPLGPTHSWTGPLRAGPAQPRRLELPTWSRPPSRNGYHWHDHRSLRRVRGRAGRRAAPPPARRVTRKPANLAVKRQPARPTLAAGPARNPPPTHRDLPSSPARPTPGPASRLPVRVGPGPPARPSPMRPAATGPSGRRAFVPQDDPVRLGRTGPARPGSDARIFKFRPNLKEPALPPLFATVTHRRPA